MYRFIGGCKERCTQLSLYISILYTMAKYQHQETDGQSIELAQISLVIYELICVCCVCVCVSVCVLCNFTTL